MREKSGSTADKMAAVNNGTVKHKGIEYLNVSKCSKLKVLHAVDCDLKEIDLSKNIK